MNASQPTHNGLVSYLSLFTSFGTLLCCALPSLLVLIGLGATVASILSSVPWLVTLSRHKKWVFLVAGLLIGGNVLYVYALSPRLQARARSCTAGDPSSCTTTNRTSRVILWISATIYCIGVFSAFVLGPLLMRFGE